MRNVCSRRRVKIQRGLVKILAARAMQTGLQIVSVRSDERTDRRLFLTKQSMIISLRERGGGRIRRRHSLDLNLQEE